MVTVYGAPFSRISSGSSPATASGRETKRPPAKRRTGALTMTLATPTSMPKPRVARDRVGAGAAAGRSDQDAAADSRRTIRISRMPAESLRSAPSGMKPWCT